MSRKPRPGTKTATWQDQVYDLLRQHKVTQFAYVPDAGHRILIDRSLADPDVHSVALTTEEEGVALLAGADLGGARGVLLMQSSGVGNCINMLSLTSGGRFPFLALISMRGDFGEGNPWQYPDGQGHPARAGGHGRDLPARRDAAGGAGHRQCRHHHGVPGGARGGRAVHAEAARRQEVLRESEMAVHSTGKDVAGAAAPAFVLDRREAIPKLVGRHEDFLIVTGLAGTSRDIAALTEDGAHTYSMAGAMGGACMIGLGLALGAPRQARAGGDGRRRAAHEHRLARHHRRA